MGKDSFTLVENRHAAAGHGHNLIAEEMNVHPLHPVRHHVLECEPREVPGAGGDAAEGVFGHTFHRKSGNELRVVEQVVGYSHVFGDGACTRPCVLAGFRVGVGGRGLGGGGHNSVRPSRILFMKMMMLNMMKMMMTLMMMMLLMMTLTTFIYVYIYI